jgi:F-type H+-transporting ATPase subunit b
MEKLIEEFSLGLFVWQTVIFVGLVLLLKKFAWKPILNAVNEREEGIKGALEAADQARAELENLNADNEKLLKEARAEREVMIKEARQFKDKMIADAKADAQAEADKLIAQAQETIQSEKKAAVADIKKQVAELSIAIAEKVIKEELSNTTKQDKLVSDLVKDIDIN